MKALVTMAAPERCRSIPKWRFDYGFGQVTGRQPEGNLILFQTRVEVDF
jgi:hypothetical protein